MRGAGRSAARLDPAALGHPFTSRLTETIFDAMIAALVRGEKIELRGFGSFHVRRRRSRVGYNPKTRTRVDIPAKRVLHFQAGREMRRLLAGGPTAAD